MAFQYVDLSVEESGQLRRRVRGPVLGFARSCASDQQAGAVLIDLGGKPDLEPERGEPPGHYNLLWNDLAVTAAGHYEFEKRDGAYVLVHSLVLGVPQGAAGAIEQIKQLLDEGMAVLFSGMYGRPTNVEVVYKGIGYFRADVMPDGMSDRE